MFSRTEKIVLSLSIAAVGGSLIAAAAATIVDQAREIERLKKSNRLFRDSMVLMYRLGKGENVKDAIIDHVVKNTTIPDDIRNL